jgi:hypothetical protein
MIERGVILAPPDGQIELDDLFPTIDCPDHRLS